jgi:invasion protein IalB
MMAPASGRPAGSRTTPVIVPYAGCALFATAAAGASTADAQRNNATSSEKRIGNFFINCSLPKARCALVSSEAQERGERLKVLASFMRGLKLNKHVLQISVLTAVQASDAVVINAKSVC